MSTSFDQERREDLLEQTKIMSGLNAVQKSELRELQKLKWSSVPDMEDESLEKVVDKMLHSEDQELELFRASRKDPYEDWGYDFVLTTEIGGLDYEFCGEYDAFTDEIVIRPCQLDSAVEHYTDSEINNKKSLYQSLNQELGSKINYSKLD